MVNTIIKRSLYSGSLPGRTRASLRLVDGHQRVFVDQSELLECLNVLLHSPIGPKLVIFHEFQFTAFMLSVYVMLIFSV